MNLDILREQFEIAANVADAARQIQKEEWIERFIFVSGTQWGDPPISREEAEREWEARQWVPPVTEE